jgi:pre-rRNA-processing protein TSR2
MSSNFDEVFVLAISETLSQWKSFQLALENGMGGKDSNEKLIWMKEVIKQFFKDNNDLTIEEVMDFIAEIIDNEFDTIIEDGSLQMVSSSLCKYYQLCSSGSLKIIALGYLQFRRKELHFCFFQVCSSKRT